MEEQEPELFIDYGRILQDSLQAAVRAILCKVESDGLLGDHHYYINFLTQHPNVQISKALKAEYPEEITIVLQNQFWDLQVGEEGFSVRLGFGARFEIIYVPFDAILGFSDPAAQFGLQFQPHSDEEKGETGTLPEEQIADIATPKPHSLKSGLKSVPKEAKITDFQSLKKPAKNDKTPEVKASVKASGVQSDNVVTLDKFRSAKD